nr:zinc finger protein 382-like [Caretta caretta]
MESFLEPTSQRLYKCPECGKRFRKTPLEIHMGERSFMCSDCRKGFIKKITLTGQPRTQMGKKPYTCLQKSFITDRTVATHRRRYPGKQLLVCAQCRKSFTWKENFTMHQRSHTGQRPYACRERFVHKKTSKTYRLVDLQETPP